MQHSGPQAAPWRLGGYPAWLASPNLGRSWRGYAIALAAVAVAIVFRLVLELLFEEDAPTFLVFLAPVLATSLMAGIRPGILATLLAWFAAYFVFTEPRMSFKTDSTGAVYSGVFIVEALGIVFVAGRLRHALTQLVERENELARSEARLRMAQEAASIATYEWDPATGKSVWSENAERVLGMQQGSFDGTFESSVRTVIPEDRHLVDEAVGRLFAEGKNKEQFRVRTDSGQLRWIEGTGATIPGQDGIPGKVVGVMMDVTDRLRAMESAAFIADATAELGSTLDYRSSVATVARAAVPRFCDIAAVLLMGEGETPGTVVSAVHRDAAKQELLARLHDALGRAAVPGVVARSIESATPLFVPELTAEVLDESAVTTDHAEVLRELAPRSLIVVPLVARGSPIGGLVFANEAGRNFDDQDFELAQELGRRAALAMENALLLEQSLVREGEISRANEALQMIADAGIELSRSLSLSETLNSLASLVVPRFADVCTISIDTDGTLERIASRAATDELATILDGLATSANPDPSLADTAQQVIHSGRPIYFPRIPDDLIERIAGSEEASEKLHRMEPHSLIIMPLTARGQTLGVMSFLRVGSSPEFDREDLSLAGQIARRTAVSADNARLYAEARRANDAKDEFLGMMSHELRTPITVIHGGARVLRARSPHLDDDTREGLLADIEREAERLARMLENLLALARAELDREVVLEPVLLQRLLPRLVDAQGAGSERVVTLSAEGELPAVAAEPGYIEHIVRNLVGNAIKYSPPDAPIEVVVSGCNEGASVRVLDRGFGIANEEANKIFERFYRSDRTARLAGGAGLGLAVCKRLVEAMSGEIWAVPREGGGLEVGFRLPAYKEELASYEH